MITTKEQDAIRDMLQSEGWKILVGLIKERESTLIESLLTTSPENVREVQAQIKALREIRTKPKTLLEVQDESRNEET